MKLEDLERRLEELNANPAVMIVVREFISAARLKARERTKRSREKRASKTPALPSEPVTSQVTLPSHDSNVTHKKRKRDGNGKRELPEDFYPDATSLGLCIKFGIDPEEMLAEIWDWVRSKRPRYHDWQSVFRNCVRRKSKERPGGSGRKPSALDVQAAAFARASRSQSVG